MLVEFIELPERIAAEGDIKKDESFSHRVGRQIVLAQVRTYCHDRSSRGLASIAD